MGKLNIFEISFANMTGVFYPGSVVEGHVTVELTKPMKMRGIEIKFEGKAHVRWSKKKEVEFEDESFSYSEEYSSKEKYFKEEIVVFGKKSSEGSDTVELEAGRHVYPFKFQLPEGLPSSFEGGIGHVRYFVFCKIDKPWKFDHDTKRMFTVIGCLNLNSDPANSQRCSGNDQTNLCCLCCKSGPITAQFSIDRKGWVPGEAIKCYADISNGADREMDSSYVALRMVTTFHAEGKTKTRTEEVARLKRPSIPSLGEDSWTGEELVIPPVPPSNLAGCNIIDIDYIVQLNVEPAGLALDLFVPLPIVIGTVPLLSVIQQSPPMAPVMPAPAGLDAAAAGDVQPVSPEQVVFPPLPPPIPGFPDIPPPSYNECITGPVKIREKDDSVNLTGNLKFAPAYTYYNWGHNPVPLTGESETTKK